MKTDNMCDRQIKNYLSTRLETLKSLIFKRNKNPQHVNQTSIKNKIWQKRLVVF